MNGLEHAPYFPVATFGKGHAQPHVGSRTLVDFNGHGMNRAVFEHDSLLEARHGPVRNLALHLDLVDTFDAAGRVGQGCSQFPVVREQQQAFAVDVKASHGLDGDRQLGQQVAHRLTPLRVVGRADHPPWLVHREIDAHGRDADPDTVAHDLVLPRIYGPTDDRQLVVHRDTALRDQHLALST